MQVLYDSDNFVVVHLAYVASGSKPLTINLNDPAGQWFEDLLKAPPIGPQLNCFEVVDKRSNKEVFLDGEWAMAFQRQINAWQAVTPTQEEVENILDQYSTLAQLPLVLQ